MNKIKIRKGDLVLLFCLLLLTGIGFWATRTAQADGGDQVVIRQAGKTIAVYPLQEDREILLEADWGKNKVMIKDGRVFMESADCPDQYCVKHRPISAGNDTIICLPHKLVIEVIQPNQGKEEVDGIAN